MVLKHKYRSGRNNLVMCACQSVVKDVLILPLEMSELPKYEQHKIYFAGPCPSVDYVLVIIDEYSLYLVVEL